MGIALHGWHRVHTDWHRWHGHGIVISIVALLPIMLLFWLARPGRLGEIRRASTFELTSSVAAARNLQTCAHALARAEMEFAADPTPAHRLGVARCVWRLACALPPDQAEHHQALLDRAARLLEDPRLTEHLTPDDRRVKAIIDVLCAPLIDLPGAPGRRTHRDHHQTVARDPI